MRGSIKRRCTKCGSRKIKKIVGDNGSELFRCLDGHDTFSWSFVVDIARPGEPRKQISRSGSSLAGKPSPNWWRWLQTRTAA